MKRPLISSTAFRISGAVALVVGLGLAAFWMITGSGPFPFLYAHVGSGSPDERQLGAMGATFLVVMVPCLALIVALYAVADMPSLRAELMAAKSSSVEQARILGGEPAARAFRELANVRSGDGRAATVARAVAASGGALAGFLRQDWLSDGVRTYGTALSILGFGFVAIGCDRGHGVARAAQAGALVLIVIGVVVPAEMYMRYREDFFLFELLIPISIGMLPGLLLHWAVWKRARRGTA